MAAYVALLRAINVGGTGQLPMAELRKLCESAGFASVKTFIQSGNVVFRSALPEAKVKAKLEKALATKMGKPFFAMIRTAAELKAVIERNPFSRALPQQVIVAFLDDAPPKKALAGLEIPGREEVELAGREVFIHYPEGMGRSKLKLRFADGGTRRNLNTIKKLAAMAEEMEHG